VALKIPQRVRAAVDADRGIQHHQVGREILGAGEHAEEDGAAQVLQNRDAVDHLDSRQPMHIQIANIHAPELF